MWGALAGGVISGVGGFLGAQSANKANKQIAREQMAFQENMSNTAYQRATADMRAAGINPMLAAQNGGASSPPGASAQMQSELGPAVSSAVQAAQAVASIEQIQANTELQEAQTNKTDAETKVTLASAPTVGDLTPAQISAQTGLLRAQTGTEQRRPDLVSAQIRESSARSVNEEQEGQRFRDYGPRGTIPDGIASAEAIARRAGRNLPNGEGGTAQPGARNETERRRDQENTRLGEVANGGSSPSERRERRESNREQVNRDSERNREVISRGLRELWNRIR